MNGLPSMEANVGYRLSAKGFIKALALFVLNQILEIWIFASILARSFLLLNQAHSFLRITVKVFFFVFLLSTIVGIRSIFKISVIPRLFLDRVNDKIIPRIVL